MRKITSQAVEAFFNLKNFKSGNTEVKHFKHYDGLSIDSEFRLHGHCIAKRDGFTGMVKISSCGWYTVTTKERLNGILSEMNREKIYQKAGIWYRNGQVFQSGEEI